MTHSLHRRGSVESLKNDFVLIARSSIDVNRVGCGPKFQRIRQILHSGGLVNTGLAESAENMANGLDVERWLARTSDDSIIASAFSSKEKLRDVISQIKKEDLGISITVSGLIDQVFGLARDLGLKPHTVNLSLGVHGKTELLPDEDTLEMTTMCGHALVASGLVKELKKDIAAGKLTRKEAARRMAEPCVCGIFNMERAEELLAK